MKNFSNKKSSGNWKDKKKSGYKGGKKSGGSGGWQRGGDRNSHPSMHSATCGQCQAACEVPFKPNGRKPVFCSDCFRKENGGGKRFDRPSRTDKPTYRSTPRDGSGEVVKQLKELNAKMDQLLLVFKNIGEETKDEEWDDEEEEM